MLRCHRRARGRAFGILVTATLLLGSIPALDAAHAETYTITPPTGLVVSRCGFSHRAPDDPIVKPGLPGAAHSHDFFGNRSTNAFSTASTLRAKTTTCKIAGDTAAYWTPTLFSRGTAVTPAGMLAYFSGVAGRTVAPMPAGLRIVAGSRERVRWSCFDHGMPSVQRMLPLACRSDELLGLGVRFPECWNGTDLDSADHRSHLAYATDDACPSTHPVRVPRLILWVLFRPELDSTQLSFSSGGVLTAHADFFNAFDQRTASTLHRYCLDAHRSCYKTMYEILRKLQLPVNPDL
jgi:hypothetical protein